MHVCACAHMRMHAKSLQLCMTLLRALLNPGIKPVSLMSPASAGGFCTTSATCLGIFNWSIVDLQSCVNFSYMCTQTHTHTFLYTHTHTHTHTHTLFHIYTYTYIGLPCGSVITNSPGTQETWIPSLDREDPWRRACNPLQYSCLENPMDRRAWQAMFHRVTKSQTWLKRLSMHIFTYIFSDSFPLEIITRYWIQFPVIYGRTLLFIL